ncbi:hypothetical protein BJ742DRAFT_736655 [Cladochytrium replicatum]|nr:hypothetical protein BJ742DRAFT_736655 [Cladochytrium replicatum]
MLAHYTTLNNHAEWRWQVYQSKQRELERACNIIATLSGTRDDWRDSKTDLFIAWGDAQFQCISSHSGPQKRIKEQLALIKDPGTQTTTAAIHATTDHGSFWTALDAILGGKGICVEP